MNPGFLSQYGSEIATLTLEHLWLTGAAMLLATVVYLGWRIYQLVHWAIHHI